MPFPCVVKPRFGAGVRTSSSAGHRGPTRTLALISGRPWWRRHGALIQELVGPTGRDFRVVVAGRHVVAGGERIAAPDEWRTSVTLGGLVVRAEVPAKARALAVAAITAVGVDFASVDLLPANGGWVVLELNGAGGLRREVRAAGVDPYRAILEVWASTSRGAGAGRTRHTRSDNGEGGHDGQERSGQARSSGRPDLDHGPLRRGLAEDRGDPGGSRGPRATSGSASAGRTATSRSSSRARTPSCFVRPGGVRSPRQPDGATLAGIRQAASGGAGT